MGRPASSALRGLGDDRRRRPGAPDIDGTVGIACDVSDPAAVAALAERVRELGPFRSLAHAAGISPTMADARRILQVDLVGTQLLLDAVEPLVVPGSAAVCSRRRRPTRSHRSSRPTRRPCSRPVGARLPRPRRRPVGGTAASPTRWPRSASSVPPARAAVDGVPSGGRVCSRRTGADRHADGPSGARAAADDADHVRADPSRPLRRPGEVADVVGFLCPTGPPFVSGIDVLVDGAMLQGMADGRV